MEEALKMLNVTEKIENQIKDDHLSIFFLIYIYFVKMIFVLDIEHDVDDWTII